MAPAPALPAGAGDAMDSNAPMFDVSVFEGSYATQFELPGSSDLASDGQKVTVSLSRTRLPVQLELLEAAPVAGSNEIVVKTSFAPPPATEHWQDRAGVAAWRQTLAADQTARFSVQYVVSYPKDARVTGLR